MTAAPDREDAVARLGLAEERQADHRPRANNKLLIQTTHTNY